MNCAKYKSFQAYAENAWKYVHQAIYILTGQGIQHSKQFSKLNKSKTNEDSREFADFSALYYSTESVRYWNSTEFLSKLCCKSMELL